MQGLTDYITVDLQAQKFVAVDNPLAKGLIEEIKRTRSPEEAACIGRKVQRGLPELVGFLHWFDKRN